MGYKQPPVIALEWEKHTANRKVVQRCKQLRKRNYAVERLSEDVSHSGNCSCLDHREEGPSVEEREESAVDGSQVDVFTTGVGKHAGNLTVAQRTEECYYPCCKPNK